MHRLGGRDLRACEVGASLGWLLILPMHLLHGRRACCLFGRIEFVEHLGGHAPTGYPIDHVGDASDDIRGFAQFFDADGQAVQDEREALHDCSILVRLVFSGN